jgi:hypothetical protein
MVLGRFFNQYIVHYFIDIAISGSFVISQQSRAHNLCIYTSPGFEAINPDFLYFYNFPLLFAGETI